MQLSTKGRYAVMAMAELARQGGARAVTLGEIAEPSPSQRVARNGSSTAVTTSAMVVWSAGLASR